MEREAEEATTKGWKDRGGEENRGSDRMRIEAYWRAPPRGFGRPFQVQAGGRAGRHRDQRRRLVRFRGLLLRCQTHKHTRDVDTRAMTSHTHRDSHTVAPTHIYAITVQVVTTTNAFTVVGQQSWKTIIIVKIYRHSHRNCTVTVKFTATSTETGTVTAQQQQL